MKKSPNVASEHEPKADSSRSNPKRGPIMENDAACGTRAAKPRTRKSTTRQPADAGRTSAEILDEIKAQMASLAVETWPADRLQKNPRNPRRHSDKQVAQIAASIGNFGFTTPIVADENGMVLAGHGRLAAAQALGLDTVPVVQIRHLSNELKRALIITDNRLAELSDWDTDLLRIELEELSALNLDFDIEITGFDTVDIDGFTHVEQHVQKKDDADLVPDVWNHLPAVSQPGEIWTLGRHRLICGSALAASTFSQLLDVERAQLVFTDPPYNVPIAGHVTSTGQHREFAMASGEMSVAEFTAFLKTAFTNMAGVSVSGAIHYVCMDWRHQMELMTAALPVYGPPKNMCVWAKTNGGMGSFYRSQHELVYVLKVGDAPHINNFGLGERGRYRTNVWTYAGVNVFGRHRAAEAAMHPTVKPVALVADAIRDCSKKNSIVLDPFGGSGTTLIAAERTGRRARLIELDPLYCDVIVRRWQDFTGESACLADGRGFDVLALERTGMGERIADLAHTSAAEAERAEQACRKRDRATHHPKA